MAGGENHSKLDRIAESKAKKTTGQSKSAFIGSTSLGVLEDENGMEIEELGVNEGVFSREGS